MINPDWLPEILTFESFNGEWNVYCEKLYEIFKNDFIDSKPVFKGTPLSLKRHPMIDNKEYTFWHITSEDNGKKVENERIPDFRRCERLVWIKPIIENSEDIIIKFWENDSRGELRYCLWLESYEYLVVLGKRNGYILLVTAYPVIRAHTKRKLEKEYQAYLNRKTT